MHALFHDSPIPRYVQVAALLRTRIERGQLAPGDKLPTLPELMATFAIARVTARQAIDVLARDGIVSAERGRGTFVRKRPDQPRRLRLQTSLDALAELYRDDRPELLLVEEATAQPVLTIEDGKPAPTYRYFKRVHARDGVRYCVISIYLDARIYRLAPKRFRGELAIPVLLDLPSVKIKNARQTLRIASADIDIATHLDVAINTPIAEVRRVFNDASGTVIYVAEVAYRGDYVNFEMDLIRG